MLCTQVLNGLLRSSQAVKFQLGDDYDILSISIDPRETPKMAAAKKETYVASYRRPGAEKGWHFLTADEATIERLTRIAGFRYRYDERSDQYAHASGIVLLTPEGRISRYFYGIDYNPNDLGLGLVESSENRIGSAVDQVLLLCYHYDPTTGKYGVAIANLIRFSGIITVLCLGTYLVKMYRVESRRTARGMTQGQENNDPMTNDPMANGHWPMKNTRNGPQRHRRHRRMHEGMYVQQLSISSSPCLCASMVNLRHWSFRHWSFSDCQQ